MTWLLSQGPGLANFCRLRHVHEMNLEAGGVLGRKKRAVQSTTAWDIATSGPRCLCVGGGGGGTVRQIFHHQKTFGSFSVHKPLGLRHPPSPPPPPLQRPCAKPPPPTGRPQHYTCWPSTTQTGAEPGIRSNTSRTTQSSGTLHRSYGQRPPRSGRRRWRTAATPPEIC